VTNVLKKNILANYVGQGAAAVMGFLVVPIYLKYLGAEGYGLVAFFMSLQTVMMIFDMGMSTSASREIARALELNPDPHGRRHMLRTLEVFYFSLCALAFLLAAGAARWLSTHWLKTGNLDAQMVTTCVYLAAGCIALRFPVALYQGFFRGMEKQVDLNVIFTNLVVIKGVGGIVTLIFISPTVLAFYQWQILFAIGEVIAMGFFAWRNLGGIFGAPAQFQFPLLKNVWSFAMRVGGISILAVLMKQLDKLTVSKLLPIEFVGYYSTASMAANAMIKIYAPVQAAVFPRFTRMVARGENIRELFHANCQFVAFVAAPATAALMVLPAEVLLMWTHSTALAESAGPSLALLALWTFTAAMQSIPNSVQLAEALTWLPLRANAITTIVLVPALYLAITKFGLIGAAFCWAIQGVLSYALVPSIMFRYCLQGEAIRYYCYDTIPFLAGALLCFAGMRAIFPVDSFLHLAVVGMLAFGCYAILCCVFSKTLRRRLESIPFGGKALIWVRRNAATRLGRCM
jgi:O-antigen/teichoic acid export membrane protein